MIKLSLIAVSCHRLACERLALLWTIILIEAMSFWTPYSDDGVLDLSKREVSVKTERLSPREACSAEAPSGYPAACDLPGSSSASLSPTYPEYTGYYHQEPHILAPYPQEQPLVPALALRLSPDSTACNVLYPERRSPGLISPISVGVETTWSGKSSPEARKAPRPFKAVTRALESEGSGHGGDVDTRYASFRDAMLAAVRARNGGSLCVSNPRMRRAVRRSKGESQDDEYLERRARNNAAAKKSRDLRRLKEDELAIRTAFLEAENQRLRVELDAVRRQLTLFQGNRIQA